MWSGLATLTALVLTWSLFGGLGSLVVGWLLVIVAVLSATGAIVLQRLSGCLASPLTIAKSFRRSDWLIALAALLIMGVLATTALGPVTHYDAGLYQLGAILYARDYGVVPGLANLFNPFGYTTAQAPLAGLISGSSWDSNGFRLINGLFASVFMADFLLRIWQRLWIWGTYVMALGLGLTLSLLIPMGDFWLASPSVDTAVFFLGLAASAYLADSLTSQDRIVPGTVVLLIGLLLVTQRPTVIPFALTSMAIVAAMLIRKSGIAGRAVLAIVSVLALSLAVVQIARDFVLSGWVLYPLSLFAFDVDWRASNPEALRVATLGAARDPSNLWGSASGWEWIPSWVASATTTWEAPALLVLLMLALGALFWSRKCWTKPDLIKMFGALGPSFLASAFWFLTSPPSFRFAWPFLFSIPILILAFSLWIAEPPRAPIHHSLRNIPQLTVALVLISIGVSSAITLIARSDWDKRTEGVDFTLGPLVVTYSVAPLEDPPVREERLPTGLRVIVPVDTEQCWQRYPLCVPRIEQSVDQRSPTIRDGFTREP